MSSRKREFIPSIVAGSKKPQLALGLKEVQAASRNERNLVNAALLSDLGKPWQPHLYCVKRPTRTYSHYTINQLTKLAPPHPHTSLQSYLGPL